MHTYILSLNIHKKRARIIASSKTPAVYEKVLLLGFPLPKWKPLVPSGPLGCRITPSIPSILCFSRPFPLTWPPVKGLLSWPANFSLRCTQGLEGVPSEELSYFFLPISGLPWGLNLGLVLGLLLSSASGDIPWKFLLLWVLGLVFGLDFGLDLGEEFGLNRFES